MKDVTRKTLLRTIKGSIGRFIAILAITALGVGFFAGLKVSKSAMVDEYDRYVQDTSLFDYRLVSTLGFDGEDVTAFSALEGIGAAEGSFAMDVLMDTGNGTSPYRAISMPEDVNTIEVLSGRMLVNAEECLVDAKVFDEADIGSTLLLSEENTEDLLAMYEATEFTIVGIASSPLYINEGRDTTALADGELRGFLYLPR